ncbi:MAG: glycine betaine ABC transporter substrate-binding protein [Candidatus Bipolaricaulia bacterium]
MKRWKIGIALLVVVAVAGGVFAATIRIGTKNFTEQYVVGNLMAILLEDRGYDVDLITNMPTTVMREAIETGALDLCMEYTGTHWLTHTAHVFKGESPELMYAQVKAYDEALGLIWLNPIQCNNTYAIAVDRAFAEDENVYTLSAFGDYVTAQNGEVPLAVTFEFYARPDGILGLQVHYGFAFNPQYVTPVLPGLTAEALIEGRSVATMVFGTDAPVVKYDWVVLQDDLNFWPPYDLCPYLPQAVLDANPGLEDILNELIAAFPNDPVGARAEMTALNAKVDIDMMEPEEVAREWLEDKGLI